MTLTDQGFGITLGGGGFQLESKRLYFLLFVPVR